MRGDGAQITRFSLKTKIIGLLIFILVIMTVLFSIWTYFDKKATTESEIVEQARVLTMEMEATWEFVSVNQYTINYDSAGNYDYKGLHCALAGRSVAALFSQHSDDIIRFTKLDPRNIANEPDEFETAALEKFAADPGTREYYGFSEYQGEQVFRYVSAMEVTENCVSCHGNPAGEIDITGYPKEGWAIGDVGGATSIIIPTDLYFENMRNSTQNTVLFFVIVVVCLGAAIYYSLGKMIADPIDELSGNLQRVDRNPSEAITATEVRRAYRSREIDELIDRFNAMSSTLSEMYENLENQVDDRTRQLALVNDLLQEQREQVEKVNMQLKRENRYKSDFLAIVSHELRTPLTSILAFTELMQEQIPDTDTALKKQLNEVDKNGQVLLEMVNNVLETARIQAGSEKINLELVDLNDVLGMVVDTSSAQAQKKNIDLTSTVSGDVPLIMSDWEKVRRIITNLVSNAIKFTGEGGMVTLRTGYSPEDDMVEICVLDTGIGIPLDKQELVFERFTQENMSTARRYGGSGLGLSLVKDLCQLLGGSVSLESTPGEGSVFTVRLPVTCGTGTEMRTGVDDVE